MPKVILLEVEGDLACKISKRIVADGGHVTCIFQNEGKKELNEDPNIGKIYFNANLGDFDQLIGMFEQADTLVMAIDRSHSFNFKHQCVTINAATSSDIQNIIFLSQYPFIGGKNNQEERLEYVNRYQKIEEEIQQYEWFRYTILRPSVTYADILHWNHEFKETQILRSPLPDSTQVSFLSEENIADVIHAIVKRPQDHDGQVYMLTGRNATDMSSFAKKISNIVAACEYERDNSIEFWKSLGFDREWSDAFVEAFNSNLEMFSLVTDDIECITGDIPPTVDEFLNNAFIHLTKEEIVAPNRILQKFEETLNKVTEEIQGSVLTIQEDLRKKINSIKSDITDAKENMLSDEERKGKQENFEDNVEEKKKNTLHTLVETITASPGVASGLVDDFVGELQNHSELDFHGNEENLQSYATVPKIVDVKNSDSIKNSWSVVKSRQIQREQEAEREGKGENPKPLLIPLKNGEEGSDGHFKTMIRLESNEDIGETPVRDVPDVVQIPAVENTWVAPTKRPTWVDDDTTSKCMLCSVPFQFFRRRHHCRNCGRLVCRMCTTKRLSLPNLQYEEPVRVCDDCFGNYAKHYKVSKKKTNK